ncbi:MAG: hypothetical protein WAM39_13610, partial [Bryobacteraceae bacterium]
MYTFAPASNVSLVRFVLSHPSQFPRLAQWCGIDVFDRVFRGWECVSAHEGEELLGLYMLDRKTESRAQIHISLLPA